MHGIHLSLMQEILSFNKAQHNFYLLKMLFQYIKSSLPVEIKIDQLSYC